MKIVKDNTKIDTWLPVFPGFYDTYFDSEHDYDMEIEHIIDARLENGLGDLDMNLIEFDTEAYELDIANDACLVMEKILSDYVTKITFQNVQSPREYNFTNDAINCQIELSQDNREEILKFLEDNAEQFKKYIEETYTSYDGFRSHYEPDPNRFRNDSDLDHKHKLGAVLQFIFFMKGIEEYNAEPEEFAIQKYKDDYCELVKQDNYIGAKNYSQVTTEEYCHECNSFVADRDYLGNVCTDCFEEGKMSGDYIVCKTCKTLIANRWEERSWQHKIKHKLVTWDQVECSDCNIVAA